MKHIPIIAIHEHPLIILEQDKCLKVRESFVNPESLELLFLGVMMSIGILSTVLQKNAQGPCTMFKIWEMLVESESKKLRFRINWYFKIFHIRKYRCPVIDDSNIFVSWIQTDLTLPPQLTIPCNWMSTATCAR